MYQKPVSVIGRAVALIVRQQRLKLSLSGRLAIK
ncbi:crossover junction endodeoxyribonuclease rusA domain protein, partial [Escherichia coli B26-1]